MFRTTPRSMSPASALSLIAVGLALSTAALSTAALAHQPGLPQPKQQAAGTIPAAPAKAPQQPPAADLAKASAARLSATVAKLDTASAHFTSAQAKVRRESFNSVIRETETEDGSIYLIREKSGAAEMGLRTEGANARIVAYRNGTLKDYIPGQANCYNTVTKPGIDTYLTLGFGGSGKDLARAWEITDLGPDTVAGTKAEKLELIAKDPAVKGNVSRVTLWMDLDKDITLKQVFLIGSTNDTYTATYSDIRLNEKKVDTRPFTIAGKPCK